MKAGKLTIRWTYHGSRTTCCDIEHEDPEFPSGFGVALCSEKDNFCRDIGRKVSLAKAMKSLHISKEYRTEVWEAYRLTKPGGRW